MWWGSKQGYIIWMNPETPTVESSSAVLLPSPHFISLSWRASLAVGGSWSPAPGVRIQVLWKYVAGCFSEKWWSGSGKTSLWSFFFYCSRFRPLVWILENTTSTYHLLDYILHICIHIYIYISLKYIMY